MKGPSAKARWGGLIAILALSILTGGWLLRRKAAPEGTVYQQARLFENVVGSNIANIGLILAAAWSRVSREGDLPSVRGKS